ncbi:MAG: hypothetical protein BroJett013_03760 [Alphaproteobacteria bacterium]|nr:MAG: hypothetical protein BroJett013_03760 [Alphaproteobacteria bacterium]
MAGYKRDRDENMGQKADAAVRSLALIRASGSTARVLNLAIVYDRCNGEPEHQEQPFFRNAALNRALVLKHVVKPEEQHLLQSRRLNTTKIVFPYSTRELELGGRSLLFHERRFERVLRDFYDVNDGQKFEADLAALRVLDALPSFDPFLIRERLRQNGFEPARCYFDLSPADITRMHMFVAREIEQLVGLAYSNGGSAARDLSQRLADKLMSDATAEPLEPLRVTLRLSPEEYGEGVFAWKGFLYYKWAVESLLPRLAVFHQEMLTARVSGADERLRLEIARMRARILDMANQAAQHVQSALTEYGVAFASLVDGNAADFRGFLLRAPSLFIPVGEAIGVLEHIECVWRFRFPPGAPRVFSAEDALELYADFEATLDAMVCLAENGDDQYL